MSSSGDPGSKIWGVPGQPVGPERASSELSFDSDRWWTLGGL